MPAPQEHIIQKRLSRIRKTVNAQHKVACQSRRNGKFKVVRIVCSGPFYPLEVDILDKLYCTADNLHLPTETARFKSVVVHLLIAIGYVPEIMYAL